MKTWLICPNKQNIWIKTKSFGGFNQMKRQREEVLIKILFVALGRFLLKVWTPTRWVDSKSSLSVLFSSNDISEFSDQTAERTQSNWSDVVLNMKLILLLFRGAGALRWGVRPVHPSSVGDVPRVCGPPPRHAQLLHKLPHLLLRLRPLQKGTLKGGKDRGDWKWKECLLRCAWCSVESRLQKTMIVEEGWPQAEPLKTLPSTLRSHISPYLEKLCQEFF